MAHINERDTREEVPLEEAIDKNLFGIEKHHENFRSMLGDYLAIATDNADKCLKQLLQSHSITLII